MSSAARSEDQAKRELPIDRCGSSSGSRSDRAATFVIAIDGPSGSGKTTVAEQLARRLGVPWLSSGALYRAVSRLVLDRFGAEAPVAAVIEVARREPIALAGAAVEAGGRALTASLHRADVDRVVSLHSAIPAVRAEVNRRLRAVVRSGPWLVEGRDIGTEVFPAAAVKIFLDAAAVARVGRRARQRGYAEEGPERGKIARALVERDRRDREKPVGALRPATDAHCIDTSGLTIAQVCDNVSDVIRSNSCQGNPFRL